MKIIKFYFLLLSFYALQAAAQNYNPKERGNFFVSNYDRSFLNTVSGNWSILQDENGVIYSSNAHDENLEQMGMIEGGHIFSTNHKGDHKKLVGVVIGNKVYATDDYKHYETLVGFIEGDAIYGCNKDGKDPHQVGTTRGGGGACGAAAAYLLLL